MAWYSTWGSFGSWPCSALLQHLEFYLLCRNLNKINPSAHTSPLKLSSLVTWKEVSCPGQHWEHKLWPPCWITHWQPRTEDPHLFLWLEQWGSFNQAVAVNDRRREDAPAEGRWRGRQFLEMITDSFPCLSCLWKEDRAPLFLNPPLLQHNCVTTADPSGLQLLPEALISPSLITVAPCSFTFPPVLLQIHFTLSVNNFLGSSVLSLNFSLSAQHSALLWNWGFHL